MATMSMLGYFGYNPEATETPLSKLRIDGHLNQIEQDSKHFFTIPDDAKAADKNILAVKPVELFDSKNPKHYAFLKRCTESFKEQIKKVIDADKKMATCLVVGLIASMFTLFILTTTLSIICLIGACYFFKERISANEEYQETLILLAAACNWSLGPTPIKDADRKFLEDDVITAMMTELYRALSESQIKHLIADEIEDVFVAKHKEHLQKHPLGLNQNSLFSKSGPTPTKEESTQEQLAASRQGAAFYLCLYGLNRGKGIDLINAFISIFPDLAKMAFNGGKQFYHRMFDKEAPATPSPKAEPSEKTPLIA